VIFGCVPLALPVFVQLTWYKSDTGKASGTLILSIDKALGVKTS
jgi:hypothetical protein